MSRTFGAAAAGGSGPACGLIPTCGRACGVSGAWLACEVDGTGAEQRWVLHVDLDMFLAAVEVLRNPELAGKPVVVGGRGIVNERAVVSTASYEAREFGIRSGMPLRTAYKKCPDAVFLPVDFPVYEAASAQVMATLRGLEWGGVPVVLEVLGWDEAFLGAGEGHGAARRPAGVRRRGARGRARRDAAALLGRDRQQQAAGQDRHRLRQAARHLHDHRRDVVRGDGRPAHASAVGRGRQDRRTARRRSASRRCGSSRRSDTDVLVGEFGPTMGPWFHRLGRGVDSSPVDATPWVARAHGREETYQRDLEWGEVPDAVRALTEQALADIDKEGRPAAAGVPQDPLPQLLHPHPLAQAARAEQRPDRAGRRRRRPARQGRAGQARAAARGPARDGRAPGWLLARTPRVDGGRTSAGWEHALRGTGGGRTRSARDQPRPRLLPEGRRDAAVVGRGRGGRQRDDARAGPPLRARAAGGRRDLHVAVDELPARPGERR